MFKKIKDMILGESHFDPNEDVSPRRYMQFLILFILAVVFFGKAYGYYKEWDVLRDDNGLMAWCFAYGAAGITMFIWGLRNLRDYKLRVKYYFGHTTKSDRWEDISIAGLTIMIIAILGLIAFGAFTILALRKDPSALAVFLPVDKILLGALIIGIVIWRGAKLFYNDK